jgi:hypothetical protein
LYIHRDLPLNLVVNHLVPLLVEHHELVPVLVYGLGMEVGIEALLRVLEEALDAAELVRDPLFLVQPRRNVLNAEALGVLGQPEEKSRTIICEFHNFANSAKI